jgi:hypothetical protein
MKLRIKGNSLRLRLSKSDVAALADTGMVSDQISFGFSSLVYKLKTDEKVEKLAAYFSNNTITVHINTIFAKAWKDNEVIGINDVQEIKDGEVLKLLVEKDFQCLDPTHEDQSDNYVNPNSTC